MSTRLSGQSSHLAQREVRPMATIEVILRDDEGNVLGPYAESRYLRKRNRLL